MSDAPDPWRAVRAWVRKAEDDLLVAERLNGTDAPRWIVAFHAQQSVEKNLKALLSFLSIPFGKTHDVGDLLDLVPDDLRPQIEEPTQQKLTYYAAAGRYAEDPPSVAEDAEAGLSAAREVREAVRRHLPKEVLEAT